MLFLLSRLGLLFNDHIIIDDLALIFGVEVINEEFCSLFVVLGEDHEVSHLSGVGLFDHDADFGVVFGFLSDGVQTLSEDFGFSFFGGNALGSFVSELKRLEFGHVLLGVDQGQGSLVVLISCFDQGLFGLEILGDKLVLVDVGEQVLFDEEHLEVFYLALEEGSEIL